MMLGAGSEALAPAAALAVRSGEPTGDPKLCGWPLTIARAAWVCLASLTMGLVIPGFVVGFQRPELLGAQALREAVAEAGISFAVTTGLGLVLPMTAYALTALIVFWRRSDDWMALLFAGMLLTFGAWSTRSLWALVGAYPALETPVRLVWMAAIYLLLAVLLLFPDGRFVPSWTRLLPVIVIAATPLLLDLPAVILRLLDEGDPFGDASPTRRVLLIGTTVGVGGASLWGQVVRYRRVSTVLQRQQTKWVLWALGVFLLFGTFGLVVPSLFLDVATPFFAWAMLSSTVLSLLIPIAIANAVLRHRLYDIDRIVKRTLVYGALTALLAAAYTVPVFVLGQLLDPLEQRSRLSVATSTLLVAALFHPARRRIQGAVDRRFDRTRYDAAQTIENFASRLRHEIELDALQHELLAVVRHAMHPTAASLWLNGSTTTPKP